jgi:hypothetical protein
MKIKKIIDSLVSNSRPSLSQLEADLAELKSYVQVGKKYGVSDNCIRKWMNKYRSLNVYIAEDLKCRFFYKST